MAAPSQDHPTVRVCVLGPVRAFRGADEVPLRPRARLVLALLAANLDRGPLSADLLIDQIHGEGPPATALQSLHNTVSGLRKALGPGSGEGDEVIVRTDLGYALDGEQVELDARLLERVAVAELAPMLAGWTRPAYDGLTDASMLADESARLEVLRTERTAAAGAHLLAARDPHAALDIANNAARFDVYAGSLAGIRRRALDDLGRPAEARQVADEFAARHLSDLGVAPEPGALDGPPMDEPAPPLRRLPAPRRDRLHGRQSETAKIAAAVEGSDLVTLVGPAGVGKTRLAETAAHHRAGAVVFVPLAEARDDTDVARIASETVGSAAIPGTDRAGAVLAELPRDPVLIVLDNCEHVVDGVGELVERLRAGHSALHVLTTSRRPIGLAGERLIEVAPLDTDDEGPALLLERAGAAAPESAEVIETVRRIVRSLDGLPLALELAAPALRSLGPLDLEASLGEIVVGSPDPDADRHASVAAAVTWSLDRLGAEHRELLEAAAMFEGAFTADGAAAVNGRRGPATTRLLSQLVASSLVQRVTNAGAGRYRLLVTVRAVVDSQLDAERRATLRTRHAEFHRVLSERAVPEFVVGNGPVTLDEMERSAADCRVALLALVADRDAQAIRMANNLMLFWFFSGRLTEGRELIHATLSEFRDPSMGRARLLASGSTLAHFQGDFADVDRLLSEAIEIAETHGRRLFVLQAQGGVAMARGDIDLADDCFQKSLDVILESGGHADMSADLAATCAWYRGKHQDVYDRFDLMGKLMQSKGVPGAQARWMRGRGLAAAYLGDPEGGAVDCYRSLELERRSGTDLGMGQALLHCALVERLRGNTARAGSLLAESADRARRINDLTTLAVALAAAAAVGADGDDNDDPAAAAALGEYEEIRRRTTVGVPADLELEVRRVAAELLERLGARELASLQAKGAARAATIHTVIAR